MTHYGYESDQMYTTSVSDLMRIHQQNSLCKLFVTRLWIRNAEAQTVQGDFNIGRQDHSGKCHHVG